MLFTTANLFTPPPPAPSSCLKSFKGFSFYSFPVLVSENARSKLDISYTNSPYHCLNLLRVVLRLLTAFRSRVVLGTFLSPHDMTKDDANVWPPGPESWQKSNGNVFWTGKVRSVLQHTLIEMLWWELPDARMLGRGSIRKPFNRISETEARHLSSSPPLSFEPPPPSTPRFPSQPKQQTALPRYFYRTNSHTELASFGVSVTSTSNQESA